MFISPQLASLTTPSSGMSVPAGSPEGHRPGPVGACWPLPSLHLAQVPQGSLRASCVTHHWPASRAARDQTENFNSSHPTQCRPQSLPHGGGSTGDSWGLGGDRSAGRCQWSAGSLGPGTAGTLSAYVVLFLNYLHCMQQTCCFMMFKEH